MFVSVRKSDTINYTFIILAKTSSLLVEGTANKHLVNSASQW